MKKTEPTWKRQGFKSSYEYNLYRAKQRGYNSLHEYKLENCSNYEVKEEWRVKDKYQVCDGNAVEIPFAPGYYITPEGIIWKQHKMGHWIILSQQPHKSGYLAFQPYVDGKRRVKYVHRAVCAAFYGDRDGSYEAHHINGDRHCNTLNNLTWMSKDEHRRMPKKFWKS